MHELGLAEGILAVTVDIAGGRDVRRITVRVGALQRVAPDSLEFGFRLLAEGTPAADARLDVVPVAAVLQCRGCGEQAEMTGGIFACPACGSPELTALSGEEILVDEVELAGDPPEVIRRPALNITEPPHEHQPADHMAGATTQ